MSGWLEILFPLALLIVLVVGGLRAGGVWRFLKIVAGLEGADGATPDPDPVVVYRSHDRLQIGFIETVLQREEVPHFVRNEMSGGGGLGGPSMLMDFEVVTPPEYAELAEALIEDALDPLAPPPEEATEEADEDEREDL